jgi:hypothetical protein
MSFAALMKDTGKINAHSSANEYGKITYSLGSAFACRFSQSTGKRVVNQTGEDVVVDGIVFFPASVTVNEKDQIEVNGTMYRIENLQLAADAGSDHHYEAAVRRSA